MSGGIWVAIRGDGEVFLDTFLLEESDISVLGIRVSWRVFLLKVRFWSDLCPLFRWISCEYSIRSEV
jgi:hypothetical protein